MCLLSSVELRKSLVALKKSVADDKTSGLGDGIVVSKKDFDKFLDNVLAPRLQDFQVHTLYS